MEPMDLSKPKKWTKNARQHLAAHLASKIRPATQDDHDLLQCALSVLTESEDFLNRNLDQLREIQEIRS